MAQSTVEEVREALEFIAEDMRGIEDELGAYLQQLEELAGQVIMAVEGSSTGIDDELESLTQEGKERVEEAIAALEELSTRGVEYGAQM